MSEGAMYFWLFAAVFVYFIPTFATAGKKNSSGVFVVNLFLGWTLVGWVVALAWAVSLPRADSKPETTGPSGGTVPPGVALPSETRPCPFCAEDIKAAAIICKHCGRDIPRSEPPAADREVAPPPAAVP